MIQLEQVTKRFGDTLAVDSIDYAFRPGKLTGFLGPNGAGKSTVIRMVMNIIAPDSGRITSQGRPLNEEFRNRLGYLPEERGLYRKMKVIDHLVFFGSLKGLTRAEARRRALNWLERLELADRAGCKVEELSKGMQQKIQFIGTLLHDPDPVLFDEPFSGLDPINTEVLKEIMLELRQEGRTVFFSTHMMEQAERLCDEIVLIDKGRILLSGTLDAVRASFGRGNLRVGFAGDESALRDDPRVDRFRLLAPGMAEIGLGSEEDVARVLPDWSAHQSITHFEIIVPSLHNIFIQTVATAQRERVGGGGGV